MIVFNLADEAVMVKTKSRKKKNGNTYLMQKMPLGLLGSPGMKEKCSKTAQSTATSERQIREEANLGRESDGLKTWRHGRVWRAQPARSFLLKVWIGTSNASIIWELG